LRGRLGTRQGEGKEAGGKGDRGRREGWEGDGVKAGEGGEQK